MDKKITMGCEARDTITGFAGIVTGAAQYITGCDQYLLKPKVDDKGAYVEGHWFDHGRLECVGKGVAAKEVQSEKPGGPQSDAPTGR